MDTYNGPMKGVLRWPQLDALWQSIDPADGWYIYEIGGEPPAVTASAEELGQAIAEIDAFLRTEHEADYCGVVYTDDFEKPSLLKIYHPRKMGASCGSSGATVLPQWTLSRHAPPDLLSWSLEQAQKPAWWRQLLTRRSATD